MIEQGFHQDGVVIWMKISGAVETIMVVVVSGEMIMRSMASSQVGLVVSSLLVEGWMLDVVVNIMAKVTRGLTQMVKEKLLGKQWRWPEVCFDILYAHIYLLDFLTAKLWDVGIYFSAIQRRHFRFSTTRVISDP